MAVRPAGAAATMKRLLVVIENPLLVKFVVAGIHFEPQRRGDAEKSNKKSNG